MSTPDRLISTGPDRTLPSWVQVPARSVVGTGRVVCGGLTRADVLAALAQAEALGKGTIVEFPPGLYTVGDGIDLTGSSCQIRGASVAGPTNNQAGTIFYADTQDGPVLDFTGWEAPAGFLGKVWHGGFGVYGSFEGDATKANAGIRLGSCSSTSFRDIVIRGTGGPGVECVESVGDAVYLCEFERIVIETPVSAKTNDVPYLIANAPNDNLWSRIGFRSTVAAADVGASGALVIVGNATYAGYGNTFSDVWFENLHVPTDGCLISHAGNTATFRDVVFHDCFKESGATGTAFVRLDAPAAENYGGNAWRGVIPADGGGATEIDMGIVVGQSNNRIDGVRGYGTTPCVQLLSGVQRTAGLIGGSVSAVSGPAVDDDSTNATNAILDVSTGRPEVTGSAGGNAALESLLTTLAGLGVITDSTT